MNLKENLPSRPATAAPGFAGDGITATPRSGFGRAFAWLLLAFALLAPAAQAGAPTGAPSGIITKTYSFVASGFTSGPETRVTASITVTFDAATTVQDQSDGITVNNLSIPYTGSIRFSYNSLNGFAILGAYDSTTGLRSEFNDFEVVIARAAVAPSYSQFAYTRSVRAQTYRASTTSIGDIVSGGWVNGANFSIGGIGTANDVNNWPAAESPWQAADGNAATKFLLFKGSNAGLIITPPSAAIYNRLALTTAGDAPERDPASYKIYGSTTALPTSGNIPIGSLTLIQQGTLALTDVRNNGTTAAGPSIVQFSNTTAYASYVVVFPTVKNNFGNNLTQIAEVKLSQGATVPDQVIVGKAVGGKLVGGSWSNGSIRQSGNAEGNNWPAAQSPDYALDGDATTKYLHFQGPNAALGIRPETSPAVINSVSFWTANDEAARDPFNYEIWGNNFGSNPFVGSVPTSSWILLKSGNLGLPPDRNFGPVTVNFPNTTAYAYYAVVFPAVKDSPSVLLTQISEVAFANVTLNAAPSDITLSNATLPENNAANATIGTLTATDTDAGQTHTFALVAGAGSTDNAAFTITGNTLKISASADFETKPSYAIRIRATDSGPGNLTFEKNFTVTITDVTIPQTITFAPLANKTYGDTAFTVSATGGASGQPVTFSLIGADPALVRISFNTVSLNGAGTFTVRASQAGLGDYSAATPVDQSFTVAKAPQAITFNLATTALTTDTVTLSASGGLSGLPVSFSRVSGPGSIAGNALTFTGPGAVLVRASQAGSANYLAAADVDRTITASVPVTAPVITTPTSASVLATTATLGGNVTSDGGSTITERGVVYSLTSANADPLISGSGVTKVTTTGTTGIFTVPVTGLTASSGYSFKAYAISAGGEFYAYTSVASFTTAAPPNAAPTDITLSNATLAENNAANATVGTLTATDANGGDTHTFTLVAGTGSTDNAAFTITGCALKINAAADFETKSSYAIRIRATDSGAGNLTFEKPFTITITDVNEAPIGGADNIARRDNTRLAKVSKALLLANDTDPEGDPRTITAVSNAQPSGAEVGFLGGFVTYIAPSNNAGDGSFDYTLSDGHGYTVTVTVTVTQVVVPPAALPPNAVRILAVGSDFVISYIGVPGNQYRIQYTTSAGPAYVWQEFDPSAVYTAPANGVFIHTDVNPPGPVRLYRAIPHP